MLCRPLTLPGYGPLQARRGRTLFFTSICSLEVCSFSKSAYPLGMRFAGTLLCTCGLGRRCLLSLLMLPLALPGAAQSGPAPSQKLTVPDQSLLAELSSVSKEQAGVAAYIHTPFKKGLGVLAAGNNEVITARHNVLAPSGELADSILVGVSQPSSLTLLELPSTVVAQDLAHDLVLLRLNGHAPAAGTAAGAGIPRAAADPAPAAASSTRTSSPARRRTHHAGGRARGAHSRHHASTADAATSGPKLHIVYDGPVRR